MAYIKANMRKKDDPFREPRKSADSGKADPGFGYQPSRSSMGDSGPGVMSSRQSDEVQRSQMRQPASSTASPTNTPPPPPNSPMDPPPQRIRSNDHFGSRDVALREKSAHKAAGLTKRHYGMNNELLSAKTPEGGTITGEKKSGLASLPEPRTGSPFDPPRVSSGEVTSVDMEQKKWADPKKKEQARNKELADQNLSRDVSAMTRKKHS